MTEGRTVTLDEVEPTKAVGMLGKAGYTRNTDIKDAVPKFKQLSYKAFNAEYFLEGDGIVIHFFVPTKRKVTKQFWTRDFAEALNDIGQEHFQATAPRLVAKYTEEVKSWWFKAQGYGHIIDLDTYLVRFFEKMEARMAQSLQTQSKVV